MFAASPTANGPNLLARLLAARTLQQVDDCAKAAWFLNGNGLIADEEMGYLAPVIEHQRRSISAGERKAKVAELARHCRPAIPSQKRAAAWLRRRALAKDCIIPTCLARMFTVSKLAVLAVIARAAVDRGQSNMSLPEIAARAGVGCTTARYAIRDAVQMGLISVRENRINEFWNRPNTIRIVCGRWLRWLRTRAAYSEVRGSTRRPSLDALDTPLRNLIPTIEIIQFTLQSTVQQQAARPSTPPVWRGDAGFGGKQKALV